MDKEELDISWLLEKEKELEKNDVIPDNIKEDDNKQHKTQTDDYFNVDKMQKECSQFINITCIYVNETNEMEYVFKEKKNLLPPPENMEQILTKEEIFKLIHTNKTKNGKRYGLNEMFKYICGIDNKKKINCMEDMIIEPSLKIFHPINNIYLIYKEHKKHNNPTIKILDEIEGVAQHSQELPELHESTKPTTKKTKKVRFDENHKHEKTKRKYPLIIKN